MKLIIGSVKMFETIKAWAKTLKRQIFILYFACKDQRVPWYAKTFTICIVAYVFSPIDLIPDFIPILGFLDDIVLLPLGIFVALKMIPKNILLECEVQAERWMNHDKPKNWVAASIIIFIWAFIVIWAIFKIYRYFN